MQNQLQQIARQLLIDKKADVVIGYGELEGGRIGAVFISSPDDCGRLVWNERCVQNLAVYLTRCEVKKLGRPAIVVKGCDARALVVLANEGQIDREQVTALGMVCDGARDDAGNLLAKCEVCDSAVPALVDEIIGARTTENKPPLNREEKLSKGKYAKLAKLRAMPVDERLAFWREEFSRCVKCYACRQSCPLCYCNVCVADKNRPVRIDTSSTLTGNFAWNILRAFHLAGRCVGCGTCAAACPAGIDLDLLNLTLADAAETHFGYIAGTEPGALPLIGSFSEDDKEDFIQ